MPTPQTTKKEFIQQMKDQHHNWEEIFSRYRSVNPQARPQQAYVNPPYLAPPGYVLSPFQPQRNWPPQGYNSYWENKTKSPDQSVGKPVEPRPQPQLPAPKQPLMITAGSAIPNQYHYNNQGNGPFRAKDRYYRA